MLRRRPCGRSACGYRTAVAALAKPATLGDDPLEAKPTPAPVPPTWTETETVALLAQTYLRRQRARLDELARQYGRGPQLRRLQQQLDQGELLSSSSWDALEGYAQHDQEARQQQERLRLAYLARREREAHARRHQLGLATRIAQGRSALHPAIDRERLRICARCEEIAYPSSEPGRDQYGRPIHRAAERCHYCGSSNLQPWNTTHQDQLDYGDAAGPGPTWRRRT